MKLKLYTLFTLVIMIALVSCKTASKMYQKGNYDEAVQLAVKKLQKKPGDAATQKILQDAYQYAVTDHENRIQTDEASNNELKYDWIYNEYISLQSLYDAIYKAPQVFDIVQPVNYSSYIITYGEKAGNAHYERGMQWMSNTDKKSYQNAYHEFQTALAYIPGDITIQQKADDAYNAAIIYVAVLTPGVKDYQFSNYNYTSGFENSLLNTLQANSGNQFVRFESYWQLQNKNIAPDQTIEFHLTNLDPGRINDYRETKELSKEVVTKEIVYKPDSVIREYSKVKAKFTTVKRTMNADADLSIVVRDANGNRIWNNNVSSDYCWNTVLYSYTGDDRALSDEEKKLVNRKDERPPHDDEVADILMQQLNNKTVSAVRNYYYGY
ncbi:MAG: hypothetical protein JSU05_01920 [Bacteroidetes bacterium]|nr:hypothetical protein [Bacteroidota bacterium]